jgi:hypothetical protein
VRIRNPETTYVRYETKFKINFLYFLGLKETKQRDGFLDKFLINGFLELMTPNKVYSESWQVLKMLKFFASGSGIQCLFNPGSRIRFGKIGIRDKHPESATLRGSVKGVCILFGC